MEVISRCSVLLHNLPNLLLVGQQEGSSMLVLLVDCFSAARSGVALSRSDVPVSYGGVFVQHLSCGDATPLPTSTTRSAVSSLLPVGDGADRDRVQNET